MTLAVAAVIAADRRFDETHHVVLRAREGVAGKRDGDRCARCRWRNRCGRRRSTTEMAGNRAPYELADLVVGHLVERIS
jgi:hypothetical protein